LTFQPIQADLQEAIRSTLVENEGLLCLMAEQLINVLINNTTFQSQIEAMVKTKIKTKVKQFEKEINSQKTS